MPGFRGALQLLTGGPHQARVAQGGTRGAVILAVLPYLLIRGPLTRIVQNLQHRSGGSR
jgi:hypothetical protein